LPSAPAPGPVTHTLASSGHLPAAIATARNHSLWLDRQTGTHTPESLSVYGSVLLRGALAAAQHDDRATAHEMLAEAADAARRLGTDANLRGTAFGSWRMLEVAKHPSPPGKGGPR
jgi:hypothetical protein